MAEFPHLPFFVDSWIAATKHLDRVERDIYFHLLLLMWRSPGGKCPNDEAWLVRRLDIREKDETEILRRIISEFCISDGNRISQKRLLKEYEFCKLQSDRRKGKKNKKKNLNQNPPPDCAPTPTPTPTPKTISNEIAAQRLIRDNEFNLTFWPAYPVKAGKREALKAFHRARDSVSLEIIMAGLSRYAALLRQPGAPQAKYAQGWLNGERWNDEQVPMKLNGAKNGHKQEPYGGFDHPLPEHRGPKSPPPRYPGNRLLDPE